MNKTKKGHGNAVKVSSDLNMLHKSKVDFNQPCYWCVSSVVRFPIWHITSETHSFILN